MPFNAEGFFQRLFKWRNDRDAGIKILAERMDREMDGIVDGLNQVIQGQVHLKGPLTGVFGTAAAPAYSFSEDQDTGLARTAADELSLVAGGEISAKFTPAGMALGDGQLVKTYVTNALTAKADVTYVDAELAGKADKSALTTGLARKADKSALTTGLARKADVTYVDSELVDKADKSALTTGLAKKADITYVNAELAKKADASARTPGVRGRTGPAPQHQWRGTSLRFQNPDGSWGRYVDLRGPQGRQGPRPTPTLRDPHWTPTCVTGETLVLMADGSQKRIDLVRIGERVAGRSRNNTVLAYDRVVLGQHSVPELYSVNGDYLNTVDHLTYTQKGWAVMALDQYKAYHGQVLGCVFDENLVQQPMKFVGIAKTPVVRLEIGSRIAHGRSGWREVSSLDRVDLPMTTPLYSLVCDGDHTMQVAGGYILSAWARDDDFDYTTWTPIINAKTEAI